MAYPASETGNLVLKWKQEEQNQAFLADHRMRCSSAYWHLLQQGTDKVCIIYVPKKGVPGRPELNTSFPAKALLAHVEVDPEDRGRVILHLANLRLFPFLPPRELNGILFETGERFGRRDRSREQKVVREIRPENLKGILYYGEAGTMVGFGSAAAAVPQVGNLELPSFSLNEAEERSHEDPRYAARLAVIRSYLVRRQTLRMDQARCILSHYQPAFRGRPVCVEVVHLWPLKHGGRDVISNTAVMHAALHQLYDRFAFTLSDDFDIIWARDADPDLLTHGLKIGRRAQFLRAPAEMPDLANIRRHRQLFFEREKKLSLRR
jgi:hypothetical protein